MLKRNPNPISLLMLNLFLGCPQMAQLLYSFKKKQSWGGPHTPMRGADPSNTLPTCVPYVKVLDPALHIMQAQIFNVQFIFATQ